MKSLILMFSLNLFLVSACDAKDTYIDYHFMNSHNLCLPESSVSIVNRKSNIVKDVAFTLNINNSFYLISASVVPPVQKWRVFNELVKQTQQSPEYINELNLYKAYTDLNKEDWWLFRDLDTNTPSFYAAFCVDGFGTDYSCSWQLKYNGLTFEYTLSPKDLKNWKDIESKIINLLQLWNSNCPAKL